MSQAKQLAYATILYIHLAQLIPQRFLKPAVCKYPTTVNSSEINILLHKHCPWMWHFKWGNRVRNGSDRKPETGKTCTLKLALFKKSYTHCAVILQCGHARIQVESAQRTLTWQAVSATPKRAVLSSVSSLIPQCSVLYCTLSIEIFKSATFGERIGMFRAFYRGHFSHDFRAQGVTLKRKALATKCIFQI